MSEHVKCAVTGLLFQPFAFGTGVTAIVTIGAVRSMLKGALVTEAVCPAVSVTVPVTV